MNLIPIVDCTTAMLNHGAAATAAQNGTGVDVTKFEGPAIVAFYAKINSGTSPVVDWKLQDSADNSSFADVSPAIAAAQVVGTGATNGNQTIVIPDIGSLRQYARGVATPGGTSPNFDHAAILIAQPKYK